MNSDWFGIGGGDGFQTAVDPTDFNVVYTESQDGNTSRYDLRSGRGQTSIRPRGLPLVGGRGGRGAGGGTAAPAAPAQPGGAAPAAPAQPGGAAAAPAAEAAPPAQFAGGRGGPPNVLNATAPEQYRFNWNTPFMLSPHNPSIVWLGGNRLFKSLNRGDTWIASEDLTKKIDRNKVTMLGMRRRPHAALEERRGRRLQHDHLGVRIARAARRGLGRNRRWQPAGEQGWRHDVHRGREEPARPAGQSRLLDVADRRLALRRRYCLRLGRRPSRRRPQAVRVRDAQLRPDLGIGRRRPAALRQHPGGPRGSEESQPALRRHRVRAVSSRSTAARSGRSS